MWEIYAYQNADSLFGIFNAAATIHGSGDYMAAVAAVAFCGFIAALVAYAFAPEKLQGWKWLATVLLVFSVLIVPRVTVGVVDKTGGSAVKVVANVTFGVAFLGSVTSTVGHTLTGLFETAFQVIPGVGALPSELSYEKNGLMFGNRLIRETGGVAFQDPNFRTDLVNFIHNCTMYDLIDGTVDPGTFSSSDDVWALMASPNPARFTTLTSAGGSITVDTCPNAYTNLNGRLPAQLTRIQGKLAFQLNPTLPAAAANAAIAGQIQQAYLKNSIATAAATAADLIRQNAVLNAINDTSNIIGQKVNDPAAMVLAVGRAQSVAQQNAAWLNAGKVAEQALPVCNLTRSCRRDLDTRRLRRLGGNLGFQRRFLVLAVLFALSGGAALRGFVGGRRVAGGQHQGHAQCGPGKAIHGVSPVEAAAGGVTSAWPVSR